MNKYLSVGVISANVVFGESCKSFKSPFIDEFKKKIKEEDEKNVKIVKGLVTDETVVISHTKTFNSDEFLEASLVFFEAKDKDKKKVQDIVNKNLEKIKSSAKYGLDSLFYIFNIKSDKMSSVGIIEIDGRKLKNDMLGISFCSADDLASKIIFF